MCGIAGGVSAQGTVPVDAATLRRCLQVLDHRGPDGAGIWTGGCAALGHARLSIVDLDGGRQPIPNEDGTAWVVVNGEVFNHRALRSELRRRGHRFRSRSDSEVIVHLYEDQDLRLLDRLNGQYAFALWDERRQRLVLARDRLGVRPLFYTVVDGVLLFASEVKALLTDPRVPREPDLATLEEVLTYWAPLPGHTMFRGISEVPPGHYLTFDVAGGSPVLHRYWDLDFDAVDPAMTAAAAADELRDLLDDATRLRLQADVPVGAYLSGGLDSSAITALASRSVTRPLRTFSVVFDDATYDERRYQDLMAKRLGTDHHVVACSAAEIAAVFPDVVRAAETPLLRTAPAPLFLLSALVRRAGLKVVLTGEGADEMFAGYDLFKEAAVRRFWARDPMSALRPKLLERLYGWMPNLQHSAATAHLQAFFRLGLEDVADPAYSHQVRWRNGDRFRRLLAPEVRAVLAGHDSRQSLDEHVSPRLPAWDDLSRAQYLEVVTFLSQYLLSSQGDRVAMAHSVEARFPFLDHRVVEFATRVPPRLRLAGFDEKRVLKQSMSELLPPEVVRRPKQPYRAPVADVFSTADYAAELMSPRSIATTGLFDPAPVARLYEKSKIAAHLSESDSMALTAVLSTQLWHRMFVTSPRAASSAERLDVVDVGAALLQDTA